MTETNTASVSSIAKPVIAGLARHALTAAGGALMAAGYISQSQDDELITEGSGLIVLLAGVIWSWWQKHQAATAPKS